MTFGQRLARVITNAAVRSPRLWPLFRRVTERMFDRIAPQWDERRRPESLAPFTAALGAVEPSPDDVLDVGTGTGAGAAVLLERFPEARVVGVDLAEGMLQRARSNVPGATFRRADASRLPFPDASFDLVTHANMIPFFDEVARVLRPGGRALFAYSMGEATPIYVPQERLKAELGRRGFVDFADFAAGNGTALVGRKE